MYSKQWNTAFEYNGEQHYHFNKKFHKKTTLKQRKETDEVKLHICRSKGISLFEIPYWESENDEQLISYIKNCLKTTNIYFNDNILLKLEEFYRTYSHCASELEKLKEIAKNKGGLCLSEYYVSNKFKLKFKCNQGHEWLASPSHIKTGRWCPVCKGINSSKRQTDKNGLSEMEGIAIEHNGECLSTKYINNTTKLQFRCYLGHKWWARPDNIKGSPSKKRTWCPRCDAIERVRGPTGRFLGNKN
jgi:hypothetical protein